MAQSFGGDDEKIRSKVWNALSKSYKPSIDEVMNDPRPVPDLMRVEMFTKRWVTDAAGRMWASIEGSEHILTVDTMGQFFSALLAPFGAEHPFSCIPRSLTSRIGVPPADWPFIWDTVQNLFNEWHGGQGESRPKKRRKKAKTWEDDEWGQEEGEASAGNDLGTPGVQPAPVARMPAKKVATKAARRSGHPRCTSAEDCAGSPDATLIRHVLEDGPGDLYCQVCWASFKQRNPELEGVEEEEGF